MPLRSRVKYYLHLSFPDCDLRPGLFQLVLIRFSLNNLTMSHDRLKAFPKFLFVKYPFHFLGLFLTIYRARSPITKHVPCLPQRGCTLPVVCVCTVVNTMHTRDRPYDADRTTNIAGLFRSVAGAQITRNMTVKAEVSNVRTTI